MSMAGRIRVLVVGEPGLFRQGLCALLRRHRGIEVVGEAGSGEKVVLLVAKRRPDVVLIDAELPDPDAVWLTRMLARSDHPSPIVVLSDYEEHPRVAAAMSEGAVGCVTKRKNARELVAALKAAVSGGAPIPPSAGDEW